MIPPTRFGVSDLPLISDYRPSLNSPILTPPPLRRTLEAMPAGIDSAFAKGKELVADFGVNKKFHLSPAPCRDGLDRQIDALVYDLCALTPAEIKIVEGALS